MFGISVWGKASRALGKRKIEFEMQRKKQPTDATFGTSYDFSRHAQIAYFSSYLFEGRDLILHVI